MEDIIYTGSTLKGWRPLPPLPPPSLSPPSPPSPSPTPYFPASLLAWSLLRESNHLQYDEIRIPDILATVQEGQYSNIRPPLVLDVCSDPSKWPRPAGGGGAGEAGATRLWDAVICSNMIHISPQVRSVAPAVRL